MNFYELLDEFARVHYFPGLRSEADRRRLVRELKRSLLEHRALRMRKFDGDHDPASDGFHPLTAILHLASSGDYNEACWLAFLSIHFGWDGDASGTGKFIRFFYGKLGNPDYWRWRVTARRPTLVRGWLARNRDTFKGLRFGNHRKYETLNPNSPAGTPAVIESFCAWVKQHGGNSPYDAFLSLLTPAMTREESFDRLFRSFRVRRFGRTARFDFLSLLGNLELLPITPGHCYLRGATGPKSAALLTCTGRRRGRLSPEIAQKIETLRQHLGVPANVMEDALCNWQKHAQASIPCGPPSSQKLRAGRSCGD